jgi:mycothiol synthase
MGYKLKVRNCHPQEPRDAAAYEQLKKGAVFAHLLSHPYYRADKNLFFAEADGVIVGFVNVLPEPGIGRVVLDYGVSPSYRLEAVLGELLKCALKRAKELGARVAHLSIPSAEAAQAEALSNLEFKAVRRFYELRLDISEVTLEVADLTEWSRSCLKAGDEIALAHVQNRCFAGIWGYNPNTVEDITWRLKVKSNCPGDVVLAIDKGEVIGYCWTEAECGQDLSTGKRKGRIYMLGVDTDYRNRGLGKKLLWSGLLHLRNKGRELIDITVDSQNIVAVTLYRSLGFQLHGETVWYEKVVH